MKQADVINAAKRNGIPERTLRRGKRRIGVQATKQGFGKDSFWLWRLSPTGAGSLSSETHENPNENTKAAKGCHVSEVAPFVATFASEDDHQRLPKAANSNVAALEETLIKTTKTAKAANSAIGQEVGEL